MIIIAKTMREIANRNEDNITTEEELELMKEIFQEAKINGNEICYEWKYNTSDKEAIANKLIENGYEVQSFDDEEISISW